MGDVGGTMSVRRKFKDMVEDEEDSEEEMDSENEDETIARIQRAHYAQAAAMNPRRRSVGRSRPMSAKRKMEAVRNFHDFTKKLKKDTGIRIHSLVGNNLLDFSDFSSEDNKTDSDGLSEEEFVVNPSAVQELNEEDNSYIDPETGDFVESKKSAKLENDTLSSSNSENLVQSAEEPKVLTISDIINEGDLDLTKNVEISEVEGSELCPDKTEEELLDIKQEENSQDFDITEKLKDMEGISVKPVNKTENDEDNKDLDKKPMNPNAINVRRNIREVMDEKNLDASTLAAQRQESERLARVQEQQRIIREVQRQIALNRQNKIHQKTLSLLQGGSSLLKKATPGHKLNLPNTVLVKLPSGEVKKTTLKQGQLEVTKLSKPSVSSSSAQRSFKPDQKSERKEVVEIVDSSSGEETSSSTSDSDDCIMLSDSEVPASPEADEDPHNSGLHVNDAYNIPDEQGRVLINIGHDENEKDIFLAPQIARVIKPHQIGGVRFLFDNIIESVNRFSTSTGFGCILAHSMGLGKTLQIVCFCDIFLRHTNSKTVLCIMPINTLQNWVAEFNMWLPLDATNSPLAAHGEVRTRNFPIYVLNDSHKTLQMRAKVVKDWSSTGGVLMIGYELYRLLSMKKDKKPRKKKKADAKAEVEKEEKKVEGGNEPGMNSQGPDYNAQRSLDDNKMEKDCNDPGSKLDPDGKDEKKDDAPSEEEKKLLDEMYEALVRPGPDLVICDEGHRIKNSHSNISYALKQMRTKRRIVLTGYPLQNNLLEYWCMVDFVRPNYLGSKTEFCNMFERPIQNGQCIDSTPQDIRLMRYRAHVLHSLLVGFVQRRSHAVLQSTLPQKEEYVLLVRMTPLQRQLYNRFMNEVVRSASVPNPLKAFAICCKIWNHPDVLYNFLRKRNEVNAIIEEDLDLEEIGGVTKAGRPKKAPGKRATKNRATSKKPAATIPPNTSSAVPPQTNANNFGNPAYNAPPNQAFPPTSSEAYRANQDGTYNQYPPYHNSGPGYFPPNQDFNPEYGNNYYPQQPQQQYNNNYPNQYPSTNNDQSYNQNYWGNGNYYGNTEYYNNSQFSNNPPPQNFGSNPTPDYSNNQQYPPNYNTPPSNNQQYSSNASPHPNNQESYGNPSDPTYKRQFPNAPGYSEYPSPSAPSGSNYPPSNTVPPVPSYTSTTNQPPGSNYPTSNNTPSGSNYPASNPPAGSYPASSSAPSESSYPTSNITPPVSNYPVSNAPPGSGYPASNNAPSGPNYQTPNTVPPGSSYLASNNTPSGPNYPISNNALPGSSFPASYNAPPVSNFPSTNNAPTGPSYPPENNASPASSYTGNATPGSSYPAANNAPPPSNYPSGNAPPGSSYPSSNNALPASNYASGNAPPGSSYPASNNALPASNYPSGNVAPGSSYPASNNALPASNYPSGNAPPVSSFSPGNAPSGSSFPASNNGSHGTNYSSGDAPPGSSYSSGTAPPGTNYPSSNAPPGSSYPSSQTQEFANGPYQSSPYAGNNAFNSNSTTYQYENQPPGYSNFPDSTPHHPQDNSVNQSSVKNENSIDPNYQIGTIKSETDASLNTTASYSNPYDYQQGNNAYQGSDGYNCGYPGFPTHLETKPPLSSSDSPLPTWPLTDTLKTELDKIKAEEKLEIKSESDGEVKIEDLDTKKLVKDETKKEPMPTMPVTPVPYNEQNALNEANLTNSEPEKPKRGRRKSKANDDKKPENKPKPRAKPKAKGRKDRKTSKDKTDDKSESEGSEKEEKMNKEEELALVKKNEEMTYDWASDLLKDYIPGIIENSAKMELFFYILNESIKLGDRLLLFSQSLFTLNLIENFLEKNYIPGTNQLWARNTSYYRLDGSTHALEREKLINEFNANPNVYLFLVSTRAGSLGINLVGANRVIVFDASWNPCHDTQAVCRVYRYGQRKPCFVYRFVMDCCLEKKIYDRQINKQGMADRVVDECNPDAVLSMKEITNLCFDNDEKDLDPKDLTEHKDKYIDMLMQGIITLHGKLLSKEPFQHESLLVDRKEKKLSSAEKRLAQRGYELEKKAASAPKPTAAYRTVRTADGSLVQRPVASVRPMQHAARWIPADVWRRQGMTAQEMTLPLDVVIPTNSAEKTNIVLKAGQRVMVLKSPKGIYMQLESGKIIAIKTSFKGLGQKPDAKDIPMGKKVGNRPASNIPGSLKNNSAITITSKTGPRTGYTRVLNRSTPLGQKISRPMLPGQKIAEIRNRLGEMRAYPSMRPKPLSQVSKMLRPNLPGTLSITRIPKDVRKSDARALTGQRMAEESDDDTEILDSDDEGSSARKEKVVPRLLKLKTDTQNDETKIDSLKTNAADTLDGDKSEGKQAAPTRPLVLTTDEKLPSEEVLENKSSEPVDLGNMRDKDNKNLPASSQLSAKEDMPMNLVSRNESKINLLKNYRHQRPAGRVQSESTLSQLEKTTSAFNKEVIPGFRKNLDDITQSYTPVTEEKTSSSSRKKKSPRKLDISESHNDRKPNMSHSVSSMLNPNLNKARINDPTHMSPGPREPRLPNLGIVQDNKSIDYSLGPNRQPHPGLMQGVSPSASNDSTSPPLNNPQSNVASPSQTYPPAATQESSYGQFPGYGMGYGFPGNSAYYGGYGAGYYPPGAPYPPAPFTPAPNPTTAPTSTPAPERYIPPEQHW